METDRVAVLVAYVNKDIFSSTFRENVIAYITHKLNFYGRILFTLGDYLTKYSKNFDRVRYFITDEIGEKLPNGSLTGLIGMVNRSEIDISVQPIIMDEVITEIVDFTFPYKLHFFTFMTRKPEYEPQVFGILEIFSLPLWIAIALTLIAMSLVCYVTFKRRYSFDKILLHIFAVLLKQSSTLKPTSMLKKLLLFLWVVGAMFLCLAYDSVVLSFLTFPPTILIKDLPELAKSVKEGHHHCVTVRDSSFIEMFLKSKDENVRTVGRDIRTNNLANENMFNDFYYDRNKPNLALVVPADVVDTLTVGRKFVSEDRFVESISAMPVRKDFCCKKLIEKFVHRTMASGLYFKYQNDAKFLIRLPPLLKYEERDTIKRKLTLTDLAPAFLFLMFGHIISVLVLIVEILSNRKKKNKRRMRISYKEGVRAVFSNV